MIGILVCLLVLLAVIARCVYVARRFLGPEMELLAFNLVALVGVMLFLGVLLALDVHP